MHQVSTASSSSLAATHSTVTGSEHALQDAHRQAVAQARARANAIAIARTFARQQVRQLQQGYRAPPAAAGANVSQSDFRATVAINNVNVRTRRQLVSKAMHNEVLLQPAPPVCFSSSHSLLRATTAILFVLPRWGHSPARAWVCGVATSRLAALTLPLASSHCTCTSQPQLWPAATRPRRCSRTTSSPWSSSTRRSSRTATSSHSSKAPRSHHQNQSLW